MKQTDPHFKLRLPPELKAQIENAAEASKRSMSAEIVARLEDTFIGPFQREEFRPLVGTLVESIRSLARQSGDLTNEVRALRAENALLRGQTAAPTPSPPDATPPGFADTMAAALDSLPAKAAEVQSDMAELGTGPADPASNPQPDAPETPLAPTPKPKPE